jgi:hypothetical protein
MAAIRAGDLAPESAGAIDHRPLFVVPRRLAKQAGESKRGQQS